MDYNSFPKGSEKQKSIKIDPQIANIIRSFDAKNSLSYILNNIAKHELSDEQIQLIIGLVKEEIIIDASQLKKNALLKDMRICAKCVNNNFIIPDLEFDEHGICSICQLYDKSMNEMMWADNLVNDKTLMSYCEGNKSRFDVMVLYTGGKDSSFLLWYLAKKLKLRVLAATWNMPFMQDSSLRNIESAMKRLPNVEFIQRTIRLDELREATRIKMFKDGIPCLCPLIAYLLFYPVAIQENIPLIIDGAEKVQSIKIGRTFSKTTKDTMQARDRDQTIAELMLLLRSLQRLNSNREEIPFIADAKKIINYICNKDNNIPIIKHLANTDLYESWGDIVTIIKKELDWKAPTGQNSLLHTSCKIEKVKDYCQYKLYKNIRSSNIPQSIKEISAAVYMGYITREEGLKEIDNTGYFAEPESINDLLEFVNLSRADIDNFGGEFQYVIK
ncbi:MAG: hypothetical protein GX941_09925 [Candidatus Methanofastidiosa archaeon]|nr:hypothetical protein [Candidatus Methanofastidiosa archaeon]